MEPLRVKLMNDGARLPVRGSAGAAGYDLASCESMVVPPGERRVVKTGVSVAVPPGTYGRIAPRSGLAVRHGVDVLAGVIDEDYRGELAVILLNTGDAPFEIACGDRIAQLVLERIETPEVLAVDDLGDTTRGGAAFGSTGVRSV
jgi:dUTP pyrophosphatase